jgi:serine phosphatase RsbU (regulator of sigma subunit)
MSDPIHQHAMSKMSSIAFEPHGHCFLWKPGLIALHAISDLLIAIAYFSIPITLVYFVRKRKDLPFNWMFLMFGVFIIACGTTHLMSIWTVWNSDYWLEGFIKLITAVVSVITAIALFPIMPKAISLPSPSQIAAEKRELERQVMITASHIEQISKGELPEKITDQYNDNFKEIGNNLDRLTETMKGITRVAEAIADGNLDAEVKERSEHDRLVQALNRMIRRLNEIMNETNSMIQAVEKGRLDIRGNAEAFKGGWRELVTGINNLIDGLNHAVSTAAALGHEMELARKIQTSLLPDSVCDIHQDFEIAATMLPADEVGGDFYDLIFDRLGHLWVAIGDVSGHGVTPGLIMMMAQTIHTTLTTNFDCDPRGVVVKINQVLYRNVHDRLNESHFMTFTALKYLGDGRFQHAGAHLSMIVFRQKPQTFEMIRTNGIYLNFKPDISRATKNEEFYLDAGDILILYTDGLTESQNRDGKILDIDGLVKIVEKHVHRDSEAMKDMIMADIIKWCDNKRADDMTILIIKRKGKEL